MKFDKLIAQIKEVIHSGAGANLSIGSPATIGDLSFVPVARVVFGFGGGGGKSPVAKKKKQAELSSEASPQVAEENFGGGGGGSVKTEPVGIYIIKDDKARFYPVVSVREIIAAFGIISVLLLKLYKLSRKR